jgi:hypothetical protein
MWTSAALRPSTKRIINAIAAAKRWGVSVTIDEAVKAFAKKERIDIPPEPNPVDADPDVSAGTPSRSDKSRSLATKG